MAKSDERMNMIGSAIRGQAEQQSHEIIKQANDYRDSQLAAYTGQVVDSMYETVQSEVGSLRQKMLSEISTTEREGFHSLLRRREELTALVFAGAKTKLLEFSSSPAYHTWLQEELTKWKDYAQGAVLYLREKDMGFAPDLISTLPGCTPKASNTIILGGFLLQNDTNGIRVDETLDTRLARQRPWFLQRCGLRVQ